MSNYTVSENDRDYDVITDPSFDIDFGLEQPEEEETEEFLPQQAYRFSRITTDEDGALESSNERFVVTEELPELLAAFRDFLVESGFNYVEEINADCGDLVWSSSDAE